MKNLSLILITIILASCINNKKSIQEREDSNLLFTLEIVAMNIVDEELNFNVGYTILFDDNLTNDCKITSREEINSTVFIPIIRSVVRDKITLITNSEPSIINKIDFKTEINRRINKKDLSLNKENMCKHSLALFTITKIEKK